MGIAVGKTLIGSGKRERGGMDISGLSSRITAPTPPGADDLAAVLAARIAMSDKAARVTIAANAAAAVSATAEATSALSSGKVDMYL
jgi:hypothetical protein